MGLGGIRSRGVGGGIVLWDKAFRSRVASFSFILFILEEREGRRVEGISGKVRGE